MTIDVLSGASAAARVGTRSGVAALVLAFALGASGGAVAQCAGSYHAGSGAGSHGSAASTATVHSAATHSASAACATTRSVSSASRQAFVHPATSDAGAGHMRVGARWRRTEARTAGVAKTGVHSSVKP